MIVLHRNVHLYLTDWTSERYFEVDQKRGGISWALLFLSPAVIRV